MRINLRLNVEDSLQDVTAFLEGQAEVFELVDGSHVMDFHRMRGDSLLFGLLLRDHRDYLSTGMLPIMFPGELIPRCIFGPTSEPQLNIPELTLPPTE